MQNVGEIIEDISLKHGRFLKKKKKPLENIPNSQHQYVFQC